MIDREKLAQRLMATFLEELQEHVGTLNHNLLALEASPTPEVRVELLKQLFRAAHSLKGASRAVNVELLERICHRLEDLLDAHRQQTLEFAPPLFALLFQMVDGIEDAGRRLRESRTLDDSTLHDLLAAPWPDSTTVPSESLEPAEAPSTPDRSPELSVIAPPVRETSRPTAAHPATPTVRVAADKLDLLLAHSGELLVARRRIESRTVGFDALRQLARAATRDPAALSQLEHELDHLTSQLTTDASLLNQVCSALEGEVYRVRMLPFAEACGGLDRVVRDIARETNKQARLVIRGEDVELDRSVLEGLKDPLLHLVRNAVDHGMEAPGERLACGKSALATVTVSAALRGAQVEVMVADDGRGFNLDRIRQKASSRGWLVPDSDEELAKLVFVAGFSTSDIVTDISGRGIGLDVVRQQIEDLQGSVDVQFEQGKGTCFTLVLPLTLTTTRAIMVRAGTQMYALPTTNVQQIVRVAAESIQSLGGRSVLTLGGPPLSIGPLTAALGMPLAGDAESAGIQLLVIILNSGTQRAAFIVDQLLAEQEVTIKPLGARIRGVRHVSGATLLESGDIALVLNAANLIRSQLSPQSTGVFTFRPERPADEAPKRLLVVDDSMTTRALLQGILEAAGFEVETAADGVGALAKLETSSFDLVVSDVDMPRLDGFGLSEAIRQSARFFRLPIVLVTARGTEQDQARGIEVGADAYIVKSGFDQTNLLHTIHQLL